MVGWLVLWNEVCSEEGRMRSRDWILVRMSCLLDWRFWGGCVEMIDVGCDASKMWITSNVCGCKIWGVSWGMFRWIGC